MRGAHRSLRPGAAGFLAAILLAAAACGGASDGVGAGSDGSGMPMSPAGGMHGGMHGGMVDGPVDRDDCRGVAGGAVALAAEALAFDTTCLAASAGEGFTIAFENRDGAPHNVTIEDAQGSVVLEGENVTEGSIDYAVPALAAGEYPFHCHVHPDMRGVLVIE